MNTNTPPVCDYEGSDYQSSFWDQGERAYEDGAEAIALHRLLPEHGKLMLELGAGAGRNTSRYLGYEQVVLLDYSRTQLLQAQARLGCGERYIYVAADIYRLPFKAEIFDGATMIRTLHHMADAPRALEQVRQSLAPGATFVLEFANKRNLKSILRYWARRQAWSPFTREPVEFAELNFDFHPAAIRAWLSGCGFKIERTLTVSHFRMGVFKRTLPTSLLVQMDALAQWTGGLWQLSPSVFVRARADSSHEEHEEARRKNNYPVNLFRCPDCGNEELEEVAGGLRCGGCGRLWPVEDGIYDFRGRA